MPGLGFLKLQKNPLRSIPTGGIFISSPRVNLISTKRVTFSRRQGAICTDFSNMDVDAFGRYAIGRICGDNTYQVSEAELHAIESVEQTYYLPEFLSGRRAPEHEGADVGVIRRQGRIDGVGELDVHIRVD